MAKKTEKEVKGTFTDSEMTFIVENAMMLKSFINNFFKNIIGRECFKTGKKYRWSAVEMILAGAIYNVLESVAESLEWDIDDMCDRFVDTFTTMAQTFKESKEKGGN